MARLFRAVFFNFTLAMLVIPVVDDNSRYDFAHIEFSVINIPVIIFYPNVNLFVHKYFGGAWAIEQLSTMGSMLDCPSIGLEVGVSTSRCLLQLHSGPTFNILATNM